MVMGRLGHIIQNITGIFRDFAFTNKYGIVQHSTVLYIEGATSNDLGAAPSEGVSDILCTMPLKLHT